LEEDKVKVSGKEGINIGLLFSTINSKLSTMMEQEQTEEDAELDREFKRERLAEMKEDAWQLYNVKNLKENLATMITMNLKILICSSSV
jgi:hypothetical protein